MTDLYHEPWQKLTTLAVSHITTCVLNHNIKPVDKFIEDLSNSTLNKREVMTKFLLTSALAEPTERLES